MMKKKTKTIDQTHHLMDNPNNTKRLINGIKELKEGKGTERKLIEESILTSEKDCKIFFDAIENPAEPNEELRAAAECYKTNWQEKIKTMDNKEKNENLNFVETTKEEGHYCSYSSLMNVSGYGRSKEESLVSFQHNIQVLIQDLQDLKNEISAKTATEYLANFEPLKNWVKSLGTTGGLQILSQIELAEERLTEII